MRNYLKFCFLFLLVSSALSIPVAQGQFLIFRNSLEGKEAPDFTLKNLSGEDVNMASFRDGKSAVILFWATWCPHCRKALQDLSKRMDEFEEKGIRIILVDAGEPAEVVRSYVARNGINYNVLLDEENSLSENYDIIGLPTFFLINKKGVIKKVEHFLPGNFEATLNNE